MTKPMGALWRAGMFGIVIALAVGCPDDRVRLEVNTDSLNFGMSADILTIRVNKSQTTRPMAPLVVSAGVPWIEVLDCAGPEAGCISNGPRDPIAVRVRVDRSRMAVGDNVGILEAGSEGTVSRQIDVSAFTPVVPGFTASNRAPVAQENVLFTNTTEVMPGWTVFDSASSWDFGNGQTSSLRNPGPTSFSEAGNFDISLTVTATREGQRVTVEALREGFVVVGPRLDPVARFDVSNFEPVVSNPVFFTDRSDPGSAPIHSWAWNFGDNNTSTEQSPSHVFTAGGVFTVELTVTSDHGVNSTQQTLNVIQRPPLADFRADVTTIPVNIESVQFEDLSDPGSADITRWSWDFGDGDILAGPAPGSIPGTIDSFRNPRHIYRQPGTFTVILTVTTAHGDDTSIKQDYITAFALSPSAMMDADSRRPFLGETTDFTDQSDPGTAPTIDSWLWDFGDPGSGVSNVSLLQNPSHRFTAPGFFTVSLTITTAQGTDTVTNENFVGVHTLTELDRFVQEVDPAFHVSFTDPNPLEIVVTDPLGRYTAHIFDMTSQTWRSPGEVDQTEWNHWLTIIVPQQVRYSTAMLFVNGGSDNDGPPTPSEAFGLLAFGTGTVIASLSAVPNQPLNFTGDPLSPRSEDALLAYSFAQFLDSFEADAPDPEWPALLPMTKAAVGAMDATQEYMRRQNQGAEIVEDFVVVGASKRGWTTWLTGATDQRVVGIAPLVIDFLNFQPQFKHHFDVYGFFSEAIFDYVEAGLIGADPGSPSGFFSRFDGRAGQALRDIIDPYSYRDRFDSVPKLLINSTGDQFFLPDSAQFYFNRNDALQPGGFDDPLAIDGLTGEKKLAYLPNTNHGLGNGAEAFAALVPWYNSIVTGQPLPQIEWERGGPGELIVRSSEPIRSARLWSSGSTNRDFRFDDFVNQFPRPSWSPAPLTPNAQGDLIARVNPASSRWIAYFVEVEFKNQDPTLGIQYPFRFTTEVLVVADTLPVQEFILPQASFVFSPSSPETGETVFFSDTSRAGSGPVIRWLWDFGDGAISRSSGPTHSYAAPGLYAVTLTVTTVHGSDTTASAVPVF